MALILRLLQPCKIQRKTDISFLNLPGELRNLIYTFYALSTQPTSISLRQNRIIRPALARVNRQIRQEFLSLWKAREWHVDLSRVVKVHAEITNMNFDGLLRLVHKRIKGRLFLDQIRKIHLCLAFTENGVSRHGKRSLEDFIMFLDVLPLSSQCPYIYWRVRFETPSQAFDRGFWIGALWSGTKSIRGFILGLIKREWRRLRREEMRKTRRRARREKVDREVERLRERIVRMAQWW